jgi:myo-inositol-1(or 4)-monophosphatase
MTSPVLSELETLARRAGEILCQGFTRRPGVERRFEVGYKGVIDLVTEFDHRSEAFLLGEVRRRYPDHRIVAEESGKHPGQECCVWLIDPLDGTVNYAHGIPVFSVSIAYIEKGLLQLGVVFDPIQSEMFSAEHGRGAWLNGEAIRVSQANSLDRSLLATGFPYDIRTNPDNNLDNYARFALHSLGVRRLGSAALDLCYVASGRFDGFWELQLGPWDVAAGALIAQAAGAIVTDRNGSPDFLTPPCSIVAAAPEIHPQVLDMLRG